MSRSGLQTVLGRLLGKKLSSYEWTALMKKLDANGDGTIEYKVFDAQKVTLSGPYLLNVSLNNTTPYFH